MKYKYPRTYHVPLSPGTTSDDKIKHDMSCFDGKTVIITEKMDGENTSLYRDYTHARSLDSNNHPSRNYVKGIWGKIRHLIPEGWRICGENMYAEHSIHYDNLEDYFLVFSIWNDKNECLSWEDTKKMCQELGLKTVHVIKTAHIFDPIHIHQLGLFIIKQTSSVEGFVIRNAESFHYNDFSDNVVKWVRENHIQTDEHWMSKPIIKNNLKS